MGCQHWRIKQQGIAGLLAMLGTKCPQAHFSRPCPPHALGWGMQSSCQEQWICRLCMKGTDLQGSFAHRSAHATLWACSLTM